MMNGWTTTDPCQSRCHPHQVEHLPSRILCLILVSLFFDVIYALALPSFDNMTEGDAFGASLWITIFILKFVIVGTFGAHEHMNGDLKFDASAWTTFDEEGQPGVYGAAYDDNARSA